MKTYLRSTFALLLTATFVAGAFAVAPSASALPPPPPPGFHICDFIPYHVLCLDIDLGPLERIPWPFPDPGPYHELERFEHAIREYVAAAQPACDAVASLGNEGTHPPINYEDAVDATHPPINYEDAVDATHPPINYEDAVDATHPPINYVERTVAQAVPPGIHAFAGWGQAALDVVPPGIREACF